MGKKWVQNVAVALVLTTAILPVQITTSGIAWGESVSAATSLFDQGAGYQAGTYDVHAAQPTTYNWTRQSRYTGMQNGYQQWAFDLGNTPSYFQSVNAPAIGADGTIYIGSLNGTLYALYPNGTKKWELHVGDEISSEVVLDQYGTIYVGANVQADPNDPNASAVLAAVDANGTLKWKVNSFGNVGSIVLGADGTIYANDQNNNLFYAYSPDGQLKTPNGIQTNQRTDDSLILAKNGNLIMGDVDGNVVAYTTDGNKVWQTQVGDWIIGSPVIGSDGTIYVLSYGYSSHTTMLSALDANGKQIWSNALTTQPSDRPSAGPALSSDGTVYVGVGRSDDQNNQSGTLFAVDSNGNTKWTYDESNYQMSTTPLIGADGTIYVTEGNVYLGRLAAIAPNGQKKWSSTFRERPGGPPAMGPDGTVYVAGYDQLYAIGSNDPTKNPATNYVTFADSNLETAVRTGLNKPTGKISRADMQELTDVSLFKQDMNSSTVTSLSGLETAVNLQTFFMSEQSVTDLSPLKNLSNLTWVSINSTPVTDLSALSNSKQISMLNVDDTNVNDLSALSSITGLQNVTLNRDKFHDVTPLVNLPNLQYLDVTGNKLYTDQQTNVNKLQQRLGDQFQYDPLQSGPVPGGDVAQDVHLYADGTPGVLNGQLNWMGASDESSITGYNLYFVNESNQKLGTKIATVPVGQNYSNYQYQFDQVTIPAHATKVAIIANTATGEAKDLATAHIWDQNTMTNGIYFADTDLLKGEIGGTVQWQAAQDESYIAAYDVYMIGDDPNQGTFLGKVKKGSPYQLTIPNGTQIPSGQNKITVLPEAADGERSMNTWEWIGILDSTASNVETRPTIDLPVVSNVQLWDRDNTLGSMNGYVFIDDYTTDLSQVDYLTAYFMDAQGNKLAKIGDFSTQAKSFGFPAATIPDGAVYLGLFSENTQGESTNYAKTYLWDAPDFMQNFKFTDTDAHAGTIGGDITWNAAPNESQIASYQLSYVDNEWNQIGDPIAEVPKAGPTYSVHLPAGTVPPVGAKFIVLREKSPYGDVSSNVQGINLIDVSGPLPPSTVPTAGNITVTNNPLGTDDTVAVKGLTAGDVVKVYSAQTGGNLLGTSDAVASDSTTAIVHLPELGKTAGNVYVTVTSAGKGESSRISKSYLAEPSVPLTADQISVTNNRNTADGVTVTNLKAGDVIKVYGGQTNSTLLGTSTAVLSGKTTATVSIAQLGASAGTLAVTVTSAGQTESSPTTKDYDAEPPAPPTAALTPDQIVVTNMAGKADTVVVSGLTKGDVLKIYVDATTTSPLITSPAVTGNGPQKVTLTSPQLGTGAGTIYVSKTATACAESDRVAKAYLAEPSVAPIAKNFAITNNMVGTDDTITVNGLHAGDVIKLYGADKTTLLGTSDAVPSGATSMTFHVPQIGAKAGTVYATLISAGLGDSPQTPLTFAGEPTQPLTGDQIVVTNNRLTNDLITVSGLSKGDVIKVYADASSTAPLVTSPAVSGSNGLQKVTLSVKQLGLGAGTVYVTITSTGQTESNRIGKAYDAEPPAPSVAPVAKKFTILNNPEGIDDKVTVTGLKPGDVIKLYASDKSTLLGKSDAVKEGETSLMMNVTQLGTKAGTIYATLTSAGLGESPQTSVTFGGEPTKSLSSDQITVTNNRLVSDQVVVTGLTKGDVIKVYANATSTTPLATSPAVTSSNGAQKVTLTVKQLGVGTGTVYVTITSTGQTESDRTSKAYDAEPPAPTATPVAKNFTITNNIEGTADLVNVTGLKVGDVVKLYKADKVTLLATSEPVPATASSTALSIDQLGQTKGTVYATVTSTGFAESAQISLNYTAEQTPVLHADQVTVMNNHVGTSDTVAVTGLKQGDAIKVYNASGKLLGSSTVATGKTGVTISISQLSTTAGSVYVTITSTGLLESDRQLVDYVAELSKAPLASQIVVVNNPLGTNDTVTVSGLKAGDIVNVYDAQTDGKLLGTSDPVATGKTTATVSLEQLGLDAGTVYVTVTNVSQLESARVAKAYLAEATL